MKLKNRQRIETLLQVSMGLTFALAFVMLLLSTMSWMIRQGV